MLEELKKIGIGTLYQYSHDTIVPSSLPRRDKISSEVKKTININSWYDISGNHYELHDGVLNISANNFFPEDNFSIVDYINRVPSDLIIVLKIRTQKDEVAGYNLLFNRLSIYPLNKRVIVNLTNLNLSAKSTLDIEQLPNNVTISTLLDNKSKESDVFSNESFENFSLNCDEDYFQLLKSKLTPKTKERITRLREIVYNFYRFLPERIKNGTKAEKINYIYNWCCQNIEYDNIAVNRDRTLKFDRRDSQDPILTFDRRKGVCEGRARLLKALLNNCYINVPCFLVKGTSGILQHTWNEAILDDGSIVDVDISHQEERKAFDHTELSDFLKLNESSKHVKK